MTYALRVKFKSNEAPWSGGYEPAARHQPADDEAAIEWAVGMSDGLGLDYLVTLVKDDVVIPLPLRPLPPNCEDCRDTGWRQFGPGAMDKEPCGCEADIGSR
jgi:hypothetical protein